MAVPPLKIDAPALLDYDYPKSKLDLKATEQLLIGKKVALLQNLDEKKNLALASLAVSAILLFGGLVFSFMVSPILGSIVITGSVILATAGSLFFVFKRYLDPKQKIEFQKEDIRFGVFEKVLQYDADRLEGYDLLQRAIEDRSLDPKDKEKVYIAVRQLKRKLNRINIQKNEFEKAINDQYLDTFKRYKADKTYKISTLALVGPARDAQVFLIDKEFEENLKPWKDWKESSNKKIAENQKEAVNSLNLLYDDLLNNLGKPAPEPQGWSSYLWEAFVG